MGEILHVPTSPVTGTAAGEPFFELSGVPVDEGRLADSAASAMEQPTGEIRYVIDPISGHVWNTAFNFEHLRLDEGYDINLSNSPAYRQYLEQEARGFVERYGLRRGSRVLEIGCGKGTFLREVCRVGGAAGVGFDPTYIRDPKADEGLDVTFVKSLFTEEAAASSGQFDAVMIRSVLQYFERPMSLIKLVRRLAGDRDMPVYIEVPNGEHTFAGGCVWSAVYEYANWYSPTSLAMLLASCGFATRRLEATFAEGQNLVGEFVPGTPLSHHQHPPAKIVAEQVAAAHAFAEAYEATMAEWSVRLDGWYAMGRRVALWGCGARAITLLSRCDAQATRVQHCVDLNPNRHNMFLPITGHEVSEPASLNTFEPDVVIITNTGYADEIEADLAAIGLGHVETAVLPSVAALQPA